jgi:DNA-directed RNA polymerase subunit E'
MFYLMKLEDYVRVEPKLFGLSTMDAVKKQLNEIYADFYSKELGKVIGVLAVEKVEEGIIIPGDGAAYYKSLFKIICWKPEIHELVFAKVEAIEAFGAVLNLGVMNGMVHISQTMEDYVNFNKAGSLSGKNSKKTLKVKDEVLARIVAISQRHGEIKIGLTMRQPGLGKLEWLEDEKRKLKLQLKKVNKEDDKKTKKKK